MTSERKPDGGVVPPEDERELAARVREILREAREEADRITAEWVRKACAEARAEATEIGARLDEESRRRAEEARAQRAAERSLRARWSAFRERWTRFWRSPRPFWQIVLFATAFVWLYWEARPWSAAFAAAWVIGGAIADARRRRGSG